MTTPICLPCIGLGCDNVDDLATGVDSAFYSQLDYSFIVQCPDKCFCPPGLFPQTISILASTIPPVIPPIIEPGEEIILRLQGCSALITRTLAAGSTQADIAAAAQSMQAEWAGQQALCIARTTPGVNCNTGTSITVCNDQIIGWCGDITPAGTFCENLVTTGLTQAQINAAIALLKAKLNKMGQQNNCGGWLCPITVVRVANGPVADQNIFVHNVGGNTESLVGLQYCVDNPPGTCFPPSPPIPPTSVGPFATIAFSGGSTPFGVAWRMKFNGSIIISGFTPQGFVDNVTLTVGC